MSDRLFKFGARITAIRRSGSSTLNAAALPNATIIEGNRIQIKIEKSIDKEPNKGEVVITNLSEQTRAALQSKPLTVQIDAGYDGNLRHVFTGDLRYGYSDLNGPDWETHLELADGDLAYRYAFVSRSYKRGTPIATVLKECAAAMGVVLDGTALASAELQSEFASGAVLHGPVREELSRLLAPFGYGFSIQDGKIQILKDQTARADQARVISEDTGMIGSPTFSVPEKLSKPTKLHVKCLIYPELMPGARIKVQSRATNGIFRMEKVTHTADTHGDDHISEIEATPSP